MSTLSQGLHLTIFPALIAKVLFKCNFEMPSDVIKDRIGQSFSFSESAISRKNNRQCSLAPPISELYFS